MPIDLTPLLRELDALDLAPGRTLEAFIRDDDAGWDDPRLLALLDAVADAEVPIDLAAIPMAVSDALAHELVARIDTQPGLLGVHQHGCEHTNHQAEGRKCEFGDARDPLLQRLDLQRGRARLQDLLGPRLDPIFTPPWNRLSAHTPALLAELGYVALSRDRGAAPQAALPELPVDLDWCRHHRDGGPAAVIRAWTEALHDRRADGLPFGLMLHHAAMRAEEFDLLRALLKRLTRHPAMRWRSMRAVLADRLVHTPLAHAA